MTPSSSVQTRKELVVLLRAFLASIVTNVPMLALLLVPQLIRSRAGSEVVLFAGASLYLVLMAAALFTVPLVTAWAAPDGDAWSPRTASGTVRAIRLTQPRAFWRRVGEWGVLFVLGQAAGLLVALLLPYVEDNPKFGAIGEPRWILHYGSYAVQAVTVYLFSCLSFAWLGARLRALAPFVSGTRHSRGATSPERSP